MTYLNVIIINKCVLKTLVKSSIVIYFTSNILHLYTKYKQILLQLIRNAYKTWFNSICLAFVYILCGLQKTKHLAYYI